MPTESPPQNVRAEPLFRPDASRASLGREAPRPRETAIHQSGLELGGVDLTLNGLMSDPNIKAALSEHYQADEPQEAPDSQTGEPGFFPYQEGLEPVFEGGPVFKNRITLNPNRAPHSGPAPRASRGFMERQERESAKRARNARYPISPSAAFVPHIGRLHEQRPPLAQDTNGLTSEWTHVGQRPSRQQQIPTNSPTEAPAPPSRIPRSSRSTAAPVTPQAEAARRPFQSFLRRRSTPDSGAAPAEPGITPAAAEPPTPAPKPTDEADLRITTGSAEDIQAAGDTESATDAAPASAPEASVDLEPRQRPRRAGTVRRRARETSRPGTRAEQAPAPTQAEPAPEMTLEERIIDAEIAVQNADRSVDDAIRNRLPIATIQRFEDDLLSRREELDSILFGDTIPAWGTAPLLPSTPEAGADQFPTTTDNETPSFLGRTRSIPVAWDTRPAETRQEPEARADVPPAPDAPLPPFLRRRFSQEPERTPTILPAAPESALGDSAREIVPDENAELRQAVLKLSEIALRENPQSEAATEIGRILDSVAPRFEQSNPPPAQSTSTTNPE